MNPIVSIVIPVFNGEKFIKELSSITKSLMLYWKTRVFIGTMTKRLLILLY